MKTILVPTEDHDSMAAVLEATRLLARALDAYIEGFAVRASLGADVTVEPLSGVAISASLHEDPPRQAQALFESFMQAHGVPRACGEPARYSYAWPHVEPADDMALGNRGRAFDLIALGRPGPAPQNPRMAPLEAALFDAGKLVLIAPASAPTTLGRNVLVSWNGSLEQARTNAFALPLLRLAEQITVLTVEGGTTPGPSGADAALHLLRNGVKARALTVKPQGQSTGEVILEHVRSLGCDLLVKGAYTQSRFRQMIFGSATRYILDNATIPVLMAH